MYLTVQARHGSQVLNPGLGSCCPHREQSQARIHSMRRFFFDFFWTSRHDLHQRYLEVSLAQVG